MRFFNEARAANAIRHPNIIDIIDVGLLPDDNVPYMLMEFLEGESLATRLDRVRPLAVSDAVEFASQTASALAAAHSKGIVHRDLKPDNLFLVPDEMVGGGERVKVLDFGIAKLRDDMRGSSMKTRTGAIMGTAAYMSPEQCQGMIEKLDHRTDVYALGVLAFFGGVFFAGCFNLYGTVFFAGWPLLLAIYGGPSLVADLLPSTHGHGVGGWHELHAAYQRENCAGDDLRWSDRFGVGASVSG